MVEVEYFLVLGTETVTAVMTEEEEGVCLGDSTGEREGEGGGGGGRQQWHKVTIYGGATQDQEELLRILQTGIDAALQPISVSPPQHHIVLLYSVVIVTICCEK